MTPSAPTTEIGQADLQIHLPGWEAFTGLVDDREYAPDVKWPASVRTYERMETDAQVRGLLLGMFLPLRRFRWSIDPDGARDEVVEHIARDFNLPILGEDAPPPVKRSEARNRFNHDDHLRHTLRALVYGHYFFEQVGTIGDDGRWHLKKLAPRPPFTIADGGKIEVAPDGGLVAIQQGTGLLTKAIPVDRLVAYVWDQEGGNWFGRSMLRAAFKNWAIKDRLLRVDATNQERNGSGVPWFETDPSLGQKQINSLSRTAQKIRSGDTAGGAGPGKLAIKGVEGTLPDTIKSVEYHDKQMSMAMLEIFTDLGRNTDRGTHALGNTFADQFDYAQEAVADWHANVTTEHGVWDDIDWNWGIDESAPKIVYDRSSHEELGVADLVSLIDAGVIVVDPALRNAVRDTAGLPPAEDPAAVPQSTTDPVAARAEAIRVGKKLNTPASAAAGDNPFHREKFEHEVRAATDFESMQADYVSDRDELVGEVTDAQAAQIDEVTRQVTDANGDLEALAAITVTPIAGAALLTVAKRVARRGIAQVKAEASAQGVTATEPELASIDDALTARTAALDKNLSDALAQAASKKALALSGAALAPDAVATAVAEHLNGLSSAYLEEQLGGLVTQAQNTGRRETMRANPPSKVYASELLDASTCEVCADLDGTEYASVEDAELDYTVGGANECLAGLRCRGTLICTWGET